MLCGPRSRWTTWALCTRTSTSASWIAISRKVEIDGRLASTQPSSDTPGACSRTRTGVEDAVRRSIAAGTPGPATFRRMSSSLRSRGSASAAVGQVGLQDDFGTVGPFREIDLAVRSRAEELLECVAVWCTHGPPNGTSVPRRARLIREVEHRGYADPKRATCAKRLRAVQAAGEPECLGAPN
jgi:hypothetical protein